VREHHTQSRESARVRVLPQRASREPAVLRVVAHLNRLDPLRPRGMPKVAKLLPLSTAQALLEEVGDHLPEA
jgi:hypothetical protein